MIGNFIKRIEIEVNNRKGDLIMKKTLVAVFTLVALLIGVKSFAACSCNPCSKPCDTCVKPCNPCDCCKQPCCEGWLCADKVEDYFCRIGLSECQKCEARKAIEEFKCQTQCIRAKDCKCESKGDCRAYRKALRDLDCKMKLIITRCQNDDYKCVRKDIKDKVRCCHKCLINPFKRCKCCCK